MKLKIISDGFSHDTKVINQNIGEELEGVQSVEWSIQVGELSRCRLELINIPAEIVGHDLKRYELNNESSSS